MDTLKGAIRQKKETQDKFKVAKHLEAMSVMLYVVTSQMHKMCLVNMELRDIEGSMGQNLLGHRVWRFI